MADIRDWDKFQRGRWKWTEYGYERNLGPCAFGDIDAHLERNDWHLFIEAKHWDGTGSLNTNVPRGQWIALESLIRYRHTVWLLIGDATTNNPLYLRMWHQTESGQVMQKDDDYRTLEVAERRQQLGRRIADWYTFANVAKVKVGA